MNFLAHALLSFNDDDLLIGNMISDFVKGKSQYEYPPAILKGIKLHRAIDEFTDNHPATKEAKHFFKAEVGLYAGAFVDVAFDHFVAQDPNNFTDESLHAFAQKTYSTLASNINVLPPRFRTMLPYMQADNWLYNYKSNWGIRQSFGGVVRRAKYLQSADAAFMAFEKHYLPLQKCYSEFFPQLKSFAAQQL